MANEAALRDRLENPIDFTIADGTGIEKGALLKLTDPRTASLSNAQYDAMAGIAAREKVASDGRTRLAVYRRGIFDMYASGAITAGDAVCSYADANYPNYVGTAKGKVAASGSAVLGLAIETASDGEVVQVDLNIGAGGGNL